MHISTYHNIGGRDYQEDRFAVLPKFGGYSHLTLCFVCDGHGGHEASTFLQDAFPKQLLNVFRSQQEIRDTTNTQRKKFKDMLGEALENCIQIWDDSCGIFKGTIVDDRTKDDFFAKLDQKKYAKDGCTAGSTFVGMLIDLRKSRAHVINIGDSRATWIVDESVIVSTVDNGVKKKMSPIDGFKFENKDGRLQDDLAMANAVGDNTHALYGVVSRAYKTLTIDFKQKSFRAILASDGLFDVRSNHQVLYEPYDNADAIAKSALTAMIISEEERRAECQAKETLLGIKDSKAEKFERFIPKFEDNVTIIYIKIAADVEREHTRSMKKQQHNSLSTERADSFADDEEGSNESQNEEGSTSPNNNFSFTRLHDGRKPAQNTLQLEEAKELVQKLGSLVKALNLTTSPQNDHASTTTAAATTTNPKTSRKKQLSANTSNTKFVNPTTGKKAAKKTSRKFSVANKETSVGPTIFADEDLMLQTKPKPNRKHSVERGKKPHLPPATQVKPSSRKDVFSKIQSGDLVMNFVSKKSRKHA